MDIETDDLLALLSERVQAEMARTEAEQQRLSEIRWLFKQQEYLLAAVREFFGEIAERIDGLEDLLLGQDMRKRSLQKQLVQETANLNRLQEEQAARGYETSTWLENRIEAAEERIREIQKELNQ